MKKILWIVLLVILTAVTAGVTYSVFDTPFGEISVDFFAFLAGAFLVLEGAYKILTSKTPLFPDQIFRSCRVIIGVTIFTIHMLQFVH